MSFKKTIIGAVLGLGIAAGASANQVVVNSTFDLDAAWTGSQWNGITTFNDGPVSIGTGDHVELTVNFENNRALKAVDGNDFLSGWLFAGDNESAFTISNIVFDLLGFSGTGGAQSTYYFASETSGVAHIGPFLNSWSFLQAGQEAIFSGFKVSYDVDSLLQDPHNYSGLFFWAGSDVSIVDARQVPEANALVLMLLGLGSMLMFGRRKQA